MRQAGSQASHRRRGGLHRRPRRPTRRDLVNAGSSPTGPTGCGAPTSPSTPPAGQGLLRRGPRRVHPPVVGWSIADHMRSELVVDALQMAIWRRRPPAGHDRGPLRPRRPIHLLGVRHRLRAAGLLGSMGRVASSVDNSMIESFWSTMQLELLDDAAGTPRSSSAPRSSNGSRPGTTPAAGTPRCGCSAPSTTSTSSNPHRRHERHDHHTTRVRRTVGLPLHTKNRRTTRGLPPITTNNLIIHKEKRKA